MTNEECLDTYHALADLLVESNMKWVVDRVEKAISSGEAFSYEDVDESLIGHKIPSHQLSLPNMGPLSKNEQIDIDDASSPAILYPPKKQLAMLIDAIEHAVVNVVETGDYVAGYFSKKAKVDEIKFAAPKNNQESFVLNRQEVRSRLVSARKLNGLLDDLRSRIYQEQLP